MSKNLGRLETRGLTERYFAILRGYGHDLDREFSNGNIDNIRGILHKVKGNGALYGYPALSNCSQILLLGTDKNILENLSLVQSEMERILKETPNRKLVLAIDDDEAIRNVLGHTLDILGYDSYLAQGAKEGLAFMRFKMPDIILLDQFMPDKSGVWFLKNLSGSTCPIILMTALPPAESAQHHASVTAFLRKPFAISSLEEMMNRIFDERLAV